MSMTDPIADFLTRLRNALEAGHAAVEIPSSRNKVELARILKEEGFVEDYMVLDDRRQGVIRIDLKYDDKRKPAIAQLERCSKPGRRLYASCDELPRVLGGMGLAIISTSKGIMSDKEARKQRVGGEILCTVY